MTTAAIVLLSCVVTQGQGPAFDVVSVRPNNSGDVRTSNVVQPGARYNATNVSEC